MDFRKKQIIILYLDTNRFDLFATEQNLIYNFDLSPFVTNLEITNINALEEQIKNFVETSKIFLANLVIVLSENVLFVKGLPAETGMNEEDGREQKFINSVPFEHVIEKSYPIEGGKLIVATNKDYYTGIKSVFEKSGITTSLIAPIYSAGVTIEPGTAMNEEIAKSMLKNMHNLELGAMELIQEKKEIRTSPVITTQKPEKKRIFALVGVFGVLIVILILVTLNSMKTPPPTNVPQATQNTQPIITPTVVPLQVNVASSTAELTRENIRIKIVSTPSATSSMDNLANFFTAAGYPNVQKEINAHRPPSPIISFGGAVPEALRAQIANEVSRVAGNFTVEETASSDDATIFLVN